MILHLKKINFIIKSITPYPFRMKRGYCLSFMGARNYYSGCGWAIALAGFFYLHRWQKKSHTTSLPLKYYIFPRTSLIKQKNLRIAWKAALSESVPSPLFCSNNVANNAARFRRQKPWLVFPLLLSALWFFFLVIIEYKTKQNLSHA